MGRESFLRRSAGAVATSLLLVALASGCASENEDLVRGGTITGPITVDLTASGTWTVPSGVTSITVTATGTSGYGSRGGLGATVTATFDVRPGWLLSTYVGKGPGNGDCSGLMLSQTQPLIIAAGGGGSGSATSLGSYGGRGGNASLANQVGELGTRGGSLATAYNPKNNASLLFASGRNAGSSSPGGYGGSAGGSGYTGATGGGATGKFLVGGEAALTNDYGPSTFNALITWILSSTGWSFASWYEAATTIVLNPFPSEGSRGGRGGCGNLGGQGGGMGWFGFGGGGGGGGASFVASNGRNVQSNVNPSPDADARLSITYEASSTTVESSLPSSSVPLISTTSTTMTTSTTIPATTTTSTTTTIPATTTTSTTTTIPATTSTSTTTTTTIPATTTTVPVVPVQSSPEPQRFLSLRSILEIDPATRVRTAVVDKASQSTCRVVGNTIITLRSGTCRLTVTTIVKKKRTTTKYVLVVS